MRVNSIELSWFRGAADAATLELAGKSVVVYGTNGSGKSSFVDGIEYIINDGKIGHLAHEYSGKRQEKGIPNTHIPSGARTTVSVSFADNTQQKAVIDQNGSQTLRESATAGMGDWIYRRTVLRQNEVAAFIQNTKGEKYSALLPMLGLHGLEGTAENLRILAKAIETESKLAEGRAAIKTAESVRKSDLENASNSQIERMIGELYSEYCPGVTGAVTVLSRCEGIAAAIETSVSRYTAEDRRHVVLHDLATRDVNGDIGRVRDAALKLAGAADPLIAEKLQALRSSAAFLEKAPPSGELSCPACGRAIERAAFRDHVAAEQKRLQDAKNAFEAWERAIAIMVGTIASARADLAKAEIQDWVNQTAAGPLRDTLKYATEVNTDALRRSLDDERLSELESNFAPIIAAAAKATEDALPDMAKHWSAKKTVEAARVVFFAAVQAANVARADSLIGFINSLEQSAREAMRVNSERTVSAISSDIQSMWSVLHPGEPIENVRLDIPKDVDKAIDIGLKFYGLDQDSPRLTLSEGYRNSLGLCIFLALAKQDAQDRPLFLDDVVVSLDRNHRGMMAELFETQFSDRQIVVFTHDREWYTEMNQQLDKGRWAFKTLLPYETPDIGIRWSHKTTTFGDARAHLKTRPDSAGNDARKIMDVELSIIAARLKLRLQYQRGEKNDLRMALEFLERIVADSKRCFEEKAPSQKYVPAAGRTEALERARKLLVSWGNRSSHSFDVVRPEALKLIDACEEARNAFTCSTCERDVWFADSAGDESLQCACGNIRWRYGKA